jgi:hypothetical protein
MRPFVLYPEQKLFLTTAYTLTPEGALPYPESIFSTPKKTGKTQTAAMVCLYVALVIGGRFADIAIGANDLEQSTSRVFLAIVRMVKAVPALRKMAKITGNRIEFPDVGSSITAIASDFRGASGGNLALACLDELWAFESESARLLFDELVPSPARKVSGRLVVTHAGVDGTLLQQLYERGLQGEQIAPDLYAIPGQMLMYWTHQLVAPWLTPAWAERMRATQRPSAYLRQVENRFASGSEEFIPIEWWDRAAVAA